MELSIKKAVRIAEAAHKKQNNIYLGGVQEIVRLYTADENQTTAVAEKFFEV